MSEREKAEEAVARVVDAAVKAVCDLYPDLSSEQVAVMARLFMMRGCIVLKDQKAA